MAKLSGVPCRHLTHRSCRPMPARGLGRSNVLASRTLGTLPTIEGDLLVFLEVVEAGLGAGRVVEEVFVAVRGQDKSKALVADGSLDRAGHWCHVCLSPKQV